MAVRKTSYWLSVFFCSLGSVCAGPVMQAAAQDLGNQASDATPINLFDESDNSDDLPNGQTVEVGSFGEIDLHVKELDLTKVLRLLSLQSQRNIIASRNVVGTVSADLYSVDFYEALDAILTTNGFGYREKGNFIYVYTADELRELETAEKAVVTQIYRLNYLSAADASAFVSPLLSGAGSIAVSAAVNAGITPSLGDNGANTFSSQGTLVIRDYPENVEQILQVLEELDVRPRQVLIEATILESKLTDINEFGVDFSVVANFDFDQFTNPLSVVDNLINGSVQGNGEAIQSTVGNTAKAGGFKLGITNDNASVFLRALDQVTDTTVIANPKLLVLNRQRAELLVGGRLGYLSTTATETSTTQTVEFLDVGTQLTVRPFISADDFIRLELKPSLSSGEIRTLADQIVPEETTQELTTNVIVRSAQTVILGGLFQETTTVDRTQVPGAGDIPILGAAFQGVDDNTDRSEVIFLIKPTIVRDQLLAEAARSAEESIRLAQIGAKKGLLPWSRVKMTNANLKDAYQALEAGDVKKAKWHTDVALYLNPQNVDALRLKQEITGQKLWFESDSILEDAMDSMIMDQMEQQTVAEDEAFLAEQKKIEENVVPGLEQIDAQTTDSQNVPQAPAPVIGHADEYGPGGFGEEVNTVNQVNGQNDDVDSPFLGQDLSGQTQQIYGPDGPENVEPQTHAKVVVDRGFTPGKTDAVSEAAIDQADQADDQDAQRAFERELEAMQSQPAAPHSAEDAKPAADAKPAEGQTMTEAEADAWLESQTPPAGDAQDTEPAPAPAGVAEVDTQPVSDAQNSDPETLNFDEMFEGVEPTVEIVELPADPGQENDSAANIFDAIETVLPGDEAVATGEGQTSDQAAEVDTTNNADSE